MLTYAFVASVPAEPANAAVAASFHAFTTATSACGGTIFLMIAKNLVRASSSITASPAAVALLKHTVGGLAGYL